MPVTKRVARVTLGSFERGCSSLAGAELKVYESIFGRRLDQSLVATGSFAEFPATAGRVTWDLPSTTLRKGRTYYFSLSNQGSGCYSAMKLTTWAHTQPQVNGGPEGCEEFEWNNAGQYLRAWHTTGQADWDCEYAQPSSFDIFLPTGWLLYLRGSTYGPMSASRRPDGSFRYSQCYYGTRALYWKVDPAYPGNDLMACAFPQFANPDVEVEDGWHFGLEWETDTQNYTTREMYLRLDTIDYSAELREHVPTFRFDSDETFLPMSPAGLAEFYLPDGSTYEETNTLEDAVGIFEVADPVQVWEGEGIGHLSLEYLNAAYDGPDEEHGRRNGTQAEADDHIDARGDADDGFYDDDARVQQSLPEYRDRIYGRAAHGGDGRLWLQYWHFYYDNPKTYGTIGRHEGDWEMVQLRLNDAGNVDLAAYSQHGDDSAESCPPAEVQFDGARPRVYVAHESHASYFVPTASFEDRANGEGLELYNPIFEEISESGSGWLNWPGQWGGSANSPQGPQFQDPKWSDPSAWEANASNCSRPAPPPPPGP